MSRWPIPSSVGALLRPFHRFSAGTGASSWLPTPQTHSEEDKRSLAAILGPNTRFRGPLAHPDTEDEGMCHSIAGKKDEVDQLIYL